MPNAARVAPVVVEAAVVVQVVVAEAVASLVVAAVAVAQVSAPAAVAFQAVSVHANHLVEVTPVVEVVNHSAAATLVAGVNLWVQ